MARTARPIDKILGKFHEIASGSAHPPLKRAVLDEHGSEGAITMTDGPYEAAEALVYDPVALNRNATREALRSLGFHALEFATSLETLRGRLAKRSPDLLLCEVGGAEVDVCALIQAIRQGRLGDNPFVVAILTTWRRDGTIAGQALNSGADDLLARPFSAARLGERLRILVERRKEFVVASHYIGPERRCDTSRVVTQSIVVPNSLRIKTAHGLSIVEAEREIAAALAEGKRIVDAEKLRRDTMHLCMQWRMLQQRTPARRDFRLILARIGVLSAEIGHRVSGTHSLAAVEWCETLRETVQTIGASLAVADGRTPPDLAAIVQEMGEAVLALGQIFAPADSDSSRLVELDARTTLAGARSQPVGRLAAAQSMPSARNQCATAA